MEFDSTAKKLNKDSNLIIMKNNIKKKNAKEVYLIFIIFKLNI